MPWLGNDSTFITYPNALKIGTGVGATAVMAFDSSGNVDMPTDAVTLRLPRKAAAGDPAGSTGMMYYNSSTNKFRCYENGAWANCIGGAAGAIGATTQIAFNNAGTESGDANLTYAAGTTTLAVPVVSASTKLSLGLAAGAGAPTGLGLADLNSVSISSPASGQVLSYNGTNWVNSAAAGASTLNGITAATAANTPIDNTSYAQVWNWSTLATATTALTLADTNAAASTATTLAVNNATTGAGFGVKASITGTGNTGYGVYGANTGTTNTGYGGYFVNTGGGTALGVSGTLKIIGGTYYSAFAPSGSQTANVTYTLPVADATSSGYVLSSNGAGTLSWVSVAGGGAIGSDTQIAFNDGGTEAGNADLTFTKGTKTLLVGSTSGAVLTIGASGSSTSKISLGPTTGAAAPSSNIAAAVVATSEATNTTHAFQALTTAGPVVTMTTGTTAIVTLTAKITAATGKQCAMGFAVSGATTLAGSDNQSLMLFLVTGALTQQASATFYVTGLTAGSNTFTAQYDPVSAAACTFANRNLVVMLP